MQRLQPRVCIILPAWYFDQKFIVSIDLPQYCLPPFVIGGMKQYIDGTCLICIEVASQYSLNGNTNGRLEARLNEEDHRKKPHCSGRKNQIVTSCHG